MTTLNRPSWDEYFMDMCTLVASRSTCIRRKVGAVIVKENNCMATGYNGVPTGITHCGERGCLRDKLKVPSGQNHELCNGLHAEQNAIIQAARHGININGGTLYCTTFPCVICAKMLINCNINEIVYCGDYADEQSRQMLNEADILVRQFTFKLL